MSGSESSREGILSRLAEMRPELHRYCARLTGSVFDGEDVVQTTLVRATREPDESGQVRNFRAWLFRIAHNCAIDFLRAKARRSTESLDALALLPDESLPDPAETLARQEATSTAIERFLLLPIGPRSVVILKDVLGHSLAEITSLLGLSLPAAKSALHRGRAQLRKLNGALGHSRPEGRSVSPELARYVTLFNARDWDPLRALLATDVRLDQTARPPLQGRNAVGNFFTRYAAADDWYLAIAWVEGREVAAVFSDKKAERASYFMEIRWSAGEISSIRDFRYARYVAENAVISVV
jgi:RNA polymerase sigma-70 factor (ECF subfamily)